jgi:hypothetical protein
MRRHVDWQAVDEGGEVGPVVMVEAAQEVLVGLAVARVPRDDDARDELQDLAGAQYGPAVEQRRTDRALRGSVRAANGIVLVAPGDLHSVQLPAGGRRQRRCRGLMGACGLAMGRSGNTCQDGGPCSGLGPTA